MRTESRARAATVAVIAAFLLVTAWVGVGDRSLPNLTTPRNATSIGVPARSVGETLVPVDVTHAVIAGVPTASRIAEPRVGPVCMLAALAAALAALAVLRRRPFGSGIVARCVLLRGSVFGRAPPLSSLA